MRGPLFAACTAAVLAGFAPDATRADNKDAKTDRTGRALVLAREYKINDEHDKFLETLQSVADKLPVVVPSDFDHGPYTPATLNTRGAKLDAITFKVPGTTGDWAMSWEYVTPPGAGGVQWYICARNGRLKNAAFRTFSQFANYVEEGAGEGLPRKNLLIAQDLVGRLRAGEEYMMWFLFDDTEPVDFYIRIRVRDHEK